ncbi:MAG TPA: Hsp20/alpha crystallin family protein [Kofleriaceae bacterium]
MKGSANKDRGNAAQSPAAQSSQQDQTALEPHAGTSHELIRYSSFSPFDALREMFERFDFAVPRTDITHDGEQLLIQIDLPGISPDDIEVTIDDYSLELDGERRDDRSQREGNLLRTERRYGHFHRVIPLPQHVDPDSAEARFDHGVLEIKVRAPADRQRGRKLAISAVG